MPHNRPKCSNDLVFIYLEDAYSYWEDAAEMEMMRRLLFKSPKAWTGADIPLSELIASFNGLAGKYNFQTRPLTVPVDDVIITGGEAFGIVHHAIDNALVNAQNLKATQETLPLLKDLQDVLVSQWAYEGHVAPNLDKLAYRYTWSAVMTAQRIQGKQVTLEWSAAQNTKIARTAKSVLGSYAELMPEFGTLMAQSHMMHLGSGFGERASKSINTPTPAP